MHKHEITLKVVVVMDEMTNPDPEASAEIAENVVKELIEDHWTTNVKVEAMQGETILADDHEKVKAGSISEAVGHVLEDAGLSGQFVVSGFRSGIALVTATDGDPQSAEEIRRLLIQSGYVCGGGGDVILYDHSPTIMVRDALSVHDDQQSS